MNIKSLFFSIILLIISHFTYSQEIKNVHFHFDKNRNMEIVFDANAGSNKKVKVTNVDIISGENVFHNPTIVGDIFQLFTTEKNRKILWYSFQDMNKIMLSGRVGVQLYYTVYNADMQEVLKNTTTFSQNVTEIRCADNEMMYATKSDKKLWFSFTQTTSESPLAEVQEQSLSRVLVAENPFHKKVDITMMRNGGVEADATYFLIFLTTSHYEVHNEDVTVLINGKPYKKINLDRTKLDSLSVQFEQNLQLMPYLEKGNPDIELEIQVKKQGVISALRQTLRMETIRPYGEIYVLGVGINDYNEELTGFGKLKFAKEGVVDFLRCAEQKLKVKKENIRFLSEDLATKYIVLDSLKKQAKRCSDRDLLVFYFAGHGTKNGLIPYNYELINENSAILYSELKEILKSCKARNIVLICDAEFSDHFLGENDGDFSVGLLASSDKDEHSLIVDSQKNIFNHYIIKGLEGQADASGNGLISIKEITEYVVQNVKKETLDLQSPLGKATNEEIIIGNLAY